MKKGENAEYQNCLLFPHFFQNTFSPRMFKTRSCVEKSQKTKFSATVGKHKTHWRIQTPKTVV